MAFGIDMQKEGFIINDVDPETYETIQNEIQGTFWVPTSRKTGIWYVYDDKGKVVEKTEHKNMDTNITRSFPMIPKYSDYDYLNKTK